MERDSAADLIGEAVKVPGDTVAESMRTYSHSIVAGGLLLTS